MYLYPTATTSQHSITRMVFVTGTQRFLWSAKYQLNFCILHRRLFRPQEAHCKVPAKTSCRSSCILRRRRFKPQSPSEDFLSVVLYCTQKTCQTSMSQRRLPVGRLAFYIDELSGLQVPAQTSYLSSSGSKTAFTNVARLHGSKLLSLSTNSTPFMRTGTSLHCSQKPIKGP